MCRPMMYKPVAPDAEMDAYEQVCTDAAGVWFHANKILDKWSERKSGLSLEEERQQHHEDLKDVRTLFAFQSILFGSLMALPFSFMQRTVKAIYSYARGFVTTRST